MELMQDFKFADFSAHFPQLKMYVFLKDDLSNAAVLNN